MFRTVTTKARKKYLIAIGCATLSPHASTVAVARSVASLFCPSSSVRTMRGGRSRRSLGTAVKSNVDAVDNVVCHSSLVASKQHADEKIDALYDNAQAMKDLSLREQLELVNELVDAMPCLATNKYSHHDMAVLKLGPQVLPGESFAEHRSRYSKDVKKFHAMNVGTISISYSTALRNIKKHLEHRIDASQKAPSLLQNVRHEKIGTRDMKIYGQAEIFPFLHKLEVWAPAEGASGPGAAGASESDHGNDADPDPGVAVILGAGNQSILTIMDAIMSIFSSPVARPVLIKHHPLRPHLFPLCSELFAPLVERGFVHQVIDRSVEETTRIIANPKVKHVHMTGGLPTARKIEEALSKARPRASKEDVERMFTSELGCVTPWIISPGTYTKRELLQIAKNIVNSKKMNGGSNCLDGQAVLFPNGWKQKDELKELLFDQLEKMPNDPLYYPGSLEKAKDIVSRYNPDRVKQMTCADIERFDGANEDDFVQPYVVECGTYGHSDFNNHALRIEAFGPVLAIAELPGDDDDDRYLLDTAVPFVNDKDNIFGSLSCSIIHPRNADESLIREAVGALNYGCVAINTWSIVGFVALCHGGLWGGSNFEPRGESGRGLLNLYQIPNAEQSVVRSRSLRFPLVATKESPPVPVAVLRSAAPAFLSKSRRQAVKEVIKSFFN